MENEKTNMEEKKPKLKLACYLLPKKVITKINKKQLFF